ncbi:efflux RND transporter permease subunit [Vreelandella boliviensis]|uniref:efflux RND transporter permease subunit n=1 Tax=Vreelandella boliviensis TaxID=223527 RepID=UPI001B8D0187|nr:efflux RND transporter permease subunit [Halomonas boliviensis]MBS3669995.1 efflux RND transporter permease subunit [Halomonas boliviensis]
MSITAFSLQNSRLVLFIFIILTITGLALYPDYPSREEPTLPINQAIITAYHPALDVYETEALIARPIERALRELQEAKNISTSIRAGEVYLSFEIKDGTPSYAHTWLRVRERMQDVIDELPEGVSGPYVNDNYDAVAVMTVGLSATDYSFRELRDKANELRDYLYSIPGMDKVTLHGVADEQVSIELKPFVLSQYSLSSSDIYFQLSKSNSLGQVARVNFDTQEGRVFVQSGYDNLGDIEETPISLTDGSILPLSSLADVTRVPATPLNSAAYLDGNQAIVVAGYMAPGLNMVDFNSELRSHLTRWESELPVGYHMKTITDQGMVVDHVISNMISTLLETILVVTVVTVLALGFRAGSLVALAVPITGVITLVFLRVLNVELNEVSIASFIIALGILVDNPMVIVEDITKRVAHGENRNSAALFAGKTLATPILIASLTVILAFAPPVFTDNITAIYMQTLTIVIGVMLLVSWFVATMLIPIMAKWFLKKPSSPEGTPLPKMSRLMNVMSLLWDYVIARPKIFLSASVLSLIVALFLSSTIPEAFFPPSERSQLQISVELPANTPAQETAAVAEEMTQWLSNDDQFPEVMEAAAYVSEGGPRFILGLNPPEPAPHSAYFVVNVTEETVVSEFVDKLRAEMPSEYPFAEIEINPFFMGSTPPGEAAIRLIGNSQLDILKASEAVQQALNDVDNTINVKQDWERSVTNFIVKIDRSAALYAGVTRDDILLALRENSMGENTSLLREGEYQTPIVLRTNFAERLSLSQLSNIQVFSESSSNPVYLSDIARIEAKYDPSIIKKRNLMPTVTVTALNPFMTSKELVDSISRTIEEVKEEFGIMVEFGGEIEESEVTAEAIFAFLPLCVLAMIMLFIYKYNSFRKVAIIVLSVPFCAIGLLLALVVFRLPFDFMANLAIFALIGIIVSNAMLIIEQVDVEKESGKSERDSLKSALMIRFRPIMLTQITTILGLVPLLIANDPLWRSFNVVIMGGLVSGTIASFIVVPSLYVLCFGKNQNA